MKFAFNPMLKFFKNK